VATVVLNPVGQLLIKNLRLRHCDSGENRRCVAVPRRQTRGVLSKRAGDGGRGEAATIAHLSLHVYHDVAANRAAPRLSAGMLSFGLDRSPQKQQADTDEYGRGNAVASREAGLG
jgi:hypothetical protein